MDTIKNVVFDIGNVLINYTPDNVLESFAELRIDERELLNEYVFCSTRWLDLDRGDYSLKAAADMISAEIPEYESYIRKIFNGECFDLMFSVKHDTVRFMREIKTEGFNIYLLSNFSKEGFDYVEGIFEFLKEPDGRIISSHTGLIKPQKEIYELLLSKYDLKPEETLFIDDLIKNCQGAESVGIKAICFTGCEELEKEFEKYRGNK